MWPGGLAAWARATYQYHVNGTDTVGRSVGWSVDARGPVDHDSVGLAQARPNHEKSQLNRPVWGSLTLAPIITTTCYHIRHISNPSMINRKFMKPNYHNHLLPYKVAVELAAVCEEPRCELQQSFKFELYSNLYQSTHMKSTPEN